MRGSYIILYDNTSRCGICFLFLAKPSESWNPDLNMSTFGGISLVKVGLSCSGFKYFELFRYYVIQQSINYRTPIWLAYDIRLLQSWLDYRDLRMVRDCRMGRGRTTSHKRLWSCRIDLDFHKAQYFTLILGIGLRVGAELWWV